MLPHNITIALWYGILAVAWIVYLCLESFIVGSGMLHRLGYGAAKQRSIQISSGLHYDGIEVWLITAVGGTFAAFPPVFATILSSLYVPFFLLIAALILRAVAIEFMHRDDAPAWRKSMALIWELSSFLIPFILGVYFANIFRGLAVDASGYKGYIFELFDLTGLAGGIFFVANALVTGWCWIQYTTIEEKPRTETKTGIARVPIVAAGVAVVAMIVLFMGLNNTASFFAIGLYAKAPLLWALPLLAIAAGIIACIAAWRGKTLLQYIAGLATMLAAMAALFAAAFPRMVISSIDPNFGIDAYAGASSQMTLTVMTYVALVFVPIVIAYQAWKFIHFAKDKNAEP